MAKNKPGKADTAPDTPPESPEVEKEESIHVPPKAQADEVVKDEIRSIKVMAVKKGYANHRIYKPGQKFVYRYRSVTVVNGKKVPITTEQALGSWMVPESDPRYGKPAENLDIGGNLIDREETEDTGTSGSADVI